MRKKGIIILMVLQTLLCAQPNVDSLINLLKTTPADTNRLKILMLVVQWHDNEKIWPVFNEQALALSKALEKSSDPKISFTAKLTLSQALNNKGFVELDNNRFINAHSLFIEALELKKYCNDQNGIITTYCNLGAVMDKMGKLDKALEYYFLALNNKNIDTDPDRKSFIYGNIGSLYHSLQQNEKSLEYFIKAIQILEQNNSKVKSQTYSNIAAIYKNLKQFDQAIKSSFQAMAYSKKENNPRQELMSYVRLADIYSDIAQYDSSLYYSNLCLEKNKTIKSFDFSIDPLSNIAFVYIQKKNYTEAEKNLLIVYKAKDSTDNLYGKMTTARMLSVLYDSINDYKNELKYYKISAALNDSLSKSEYKTAAVKQELKYEYDKKESELKINQLRNEEEIEKHKLVRQGLLIGSGMLLVLIFFIFKNLRNTKKSQKLLAAQKREVEHQKTIIETKQQEIISSINYAKRIQTAVLSGDDVWKRISKEYFILLKPKDIVSGDFYWAHVLPNGRAVFALADCTGHGVPGGFMSMLGNSFLNEIVVENKIFNAAAILNRLRDKIITALEQKGQPEQKDGMDIGLCVWNKMDNTLEFAGANNSLYLVRDGNLQELKGNKMPIGTYITDNNPFTAQAVQLQKNDSIYLTTDGFPDQFGGPNGKKYKYKQLETVILAIQDLDMKQQREIFERDFEDWRGNLEQVDDIGLIGIKV